MSLQICVIVMTFFICNTISHQSDVLMSFSDWSDKLFTGLTKQPDDEAPQWFKPDTGCDSFAVQDKAWGSTKQTRFDFPPRDYFKCAHCSCYNCSQEGYVEATCTRRVPYAYTKMPQNLPVMTVNLNMNGNLLYNFTLEDITRYKSLTLLKLRANKITYLSVVPCENVTSLLLLDLFGNLLNSVEDGWFTCLVELTYLDLGENLLTSVSNQTFLGLSNLKHLDLSSNKLEDVQYGAFDDCENLQTLILRNNPLTYGSWRFHPRLFQPLQLLEVLSIQKFIKYSLHYPLSVLVQLKNLRQLGIDEANDDYFGKAYQVLKRMTTLQFGVDGNCASVALDDNFFLGFPFLKTLQINGCKPKSISPLAFQSNVELETLNYTNIGYNFEKLLDSLSGITHLNISILVVNYISSGNFPRTLTTIHVENIRRLPHLKELHLEGNSISIITFDFIKGLPSSLRRINLSRNLLLRANSIVKFFYSSENLAKLEILNEDLENSLISHAVVTHVDAANDSCSCNTVISEDYYTVRNYSLNHTYESIHLNMYTAVGTSQFNTDILNFQFLQVINISGAFPTRWGRYKLPKNVKVADFTNNYFEHLENSFLLPNNSLEELHAAGNFLGVELSNDVNGGKFARFQGLLYLDLSRNQIQDFTWTVFSGLERVQIIILSKNKIQKLDVNMSHLMNLRYLDLSGNSLTWISEATRTHLDLIALQHVVSLNLAYNPIPCMCTGIDFLKWLATTNVRIINKDFMECVDKNSQRKPLGDLELMTSTLSRKCASQVNLVLASSFSCAVFIILIVVFKNRWRLYYIKNLVITKWYGYNTGDRQMRGKFTFDAYILYSKQDRHFVMKECLTELEDKRGHKLCVEDRDFLLGSFVPCNITSAIQNSYSTLAIISPSFWDCEWTEYGTHMSIMESLYSKRQILHLVLYKPFPVEEMPRALIKVHKDNHFIEYPPRDCSDDVKAAFWNGLSLIIGHTDNMEDTPVLVI